MNLTDVADAARQLSSIISTLVIVAGGIWYLVRKARGYFDSVQAKQEAVLVEQQNTNAHLKTLNGSVARHEKDLGTIREHVAALEGAVFKRAPLPEEELR